MTKDEIIESLRDMARYPTVTLPRDSEALRAAADLLAQPEQEPVEWGVDWGKDGNSVSIIKRLADGNIEVLAWEYAPHPPQRTWVALADKEIDQGLLRTNYAFKTAEAWRDGVEWAMTQLREKNT